MSKATAAELVQLAESMLTNFAGVELTLVSEYVLAACAAETDGELSRVLIDLEKNAAQKKAVRAYEAKLKAEKKRIEAEARDEYNQRTVLSPKRSDGTANPDHISASQTTFANYSQCREVEENIADPDAADLVDPRFDLSANWPVMVGNKAPTSAGARAARRRTKTLVEIDAVISKWGDMEQLFADTDSGLQHRVQMLVDQRSKIFEMVSDIMKKAGA